MMTRVAPLTADPLLLVAFYTDVDFQEHAEGYARVCFAVMLWGSKDQGWHEERQQQWTKLSSAFGPTKAIAAKQTGDW